MRKLQRDIGEWGQKTFNHSDSFAVLHGAAHHLSDEVQEILAEIAGIEEGFDREKELRAEIADAGILVFQLAYALGFDLEQAILDKMEANKKRKWGKPDSRGVVKHLSE